MTFYALGQKASYFYMPADLARRRRWQPGQRIRLGGLVEKGTVVRGQGTEVAFAVTDKEKSVKVTYHRHPARPVPRGAGRHHRRHASAPDGVFVADSVLAKHDETYMPKEVADSLKAKGVWQERAMNERRA